MTLESPELVSAEHASMGTAVTASSAPIACVDTEEKFPLKARMRECTLCRGPSIKRSSWVVNVSY